MFVQKFRVMRQDTPICSSMFVQTFVGNAEDKRVVVRREIEAFVS